LKQALTIGLVVAGLAATLTFVAASSKTGVQSIALPEAQTPAQTAPYAVMAQNSMSVLNYDRGPRIIIVPQAGDRDDRTSSRASVNARRYEDDDDDIAPPVRATPRWAPRVEPQRNESPYVAPPPRRAETPARPRTETRTVRHIDMSKPKAERPTPEAAPIPQPPSPRRAVLSAPPPPAEGPTPVRPTPRFDSGLGSKAQSLGSKAEAPANPVEPTVNLTNDSPPPADITADQPPPGYTPPAAMRGEKSGDKY
jgi:hypothetical protein